jgi:hypothetical protein
MVGYVMPVKRCEKCGFESPPPGEKYCRMCRGTVLNRMKNEGYFTHVPRRSPDRPLDAQEDIRETKSGIDD